MTRFRVFCARTFAIDGRGGRAYHDAIMARRVTLDQLAAMVARGFEDVQRRFEDVDRKFAGVHQEFEDVHRKLDSHTAILEQHSAFHVDHSHRFDRIERKLDNVIDRRDDHEVRLQAPEKRRGSQP